MAAEVVAACTGGAVIMGWALHLGCDAQVVGILGALPFLAQLGQIPGAWLTARWGPRRAALLTIAVARQAFLLVAALPFLPLSAHARQAVLVCAAAAHHGLGILCNNAWNAWMGELVPERLRGRYFGRRTAITTVASAVSALAAGLALDAARGAGWVGAALVALALVACGSGAVSVALMARQSGGARPASAPRFDPAGFVRPLADRPARRLLAYLAVWNAASGLTAPFFGLYLLQGLKLGFGVLAAQAAALSAARVATAAAWGRAVDRHGARRVLLICTAGLVLSPLAWVACGPARLWPLAIETALGGVLLAGHGVASFALPLAVAPPRERSYWCAAFFMTGGVAFAASAAVGGAVAAALPAGFSAGGLAFAPLHAPFLASCALRGGAAVSAVLVLDGARAHRSRTWRVMRRGPARAPGPIRAASHAARAASRWTVRGFSRSIARRAVALRAR
jgi:MFS family permease